MADPISLGVIIAGGTMLLTGAGAVATLAGAAATGAQAAHSIRQGRKNGSSRAVEQQQFDPRHFSAVKSTANNYVKGGSESVTISPDGSIVATGHGRGDWSYGSSVTTQTMHYGGVQVPTSQAHQSMGLTQRPAMHNQHAFGMFPGPQPYQQPSIAGYQSWPGSFVPQQAPQVAYASSGFGPPPSYAQSQEKAKRYSKW